MLPLYLLKYLVLSGAAILSACNLCQQHQHRSCLQALLDRGKRHNEEIMAFVMFQEGVHHYLSYRVIKSIVNGLFFHDRILLCCHAHR